MLIKVLKKSLAGLGIFAALAMGFGAASAEQKSVEPLLSYSTSWVGNTFSGGGPGAKNMWVQNFIDEMDVSPDGVVVTASVWDEAGRCTGLYRNGKVNENLLKQYNGGGGHKAWGWGTGGRAVAVVGSNIFIINTEGELLRFTWAPPNIESASYTDQKTIGKAIGLTARDNLLVAILESGDVESRSVVTMEKIESFKLDGAKDAAIDAEGNLWVLAGTKILHYTTGGKKLAGEITDVVKPTAVSFDNKGRLIVCEDGPRQQVLFYELGDQPKLADTFGLEGGLDAGTPGIVKPHKLYGLRGAGTDAQGNLYIGISLRDAVIRSFDPVGALRWKVESLPFVDGFCFDPESDGTVIYGVDEIMKADYSKPGAVDWEFSAKTVDAVEHPDDPRINKGKACSAVLVNRDGRRILYTTGQMSGGFDIYNFEPETSQIARYVGTIGNGGWAWEVDSQGSVWQGDAQGRKIVRHKFLGWSDDGKPQFEKSDKESWPWPDDFTEIGRIYYVPESDTLYIAGCTPEKKAPSWGLVGNILVRYDGWTTGNPVARWQIDLPRDDKDLTPKSIDVAGDYIFTVQVMSTAGKPAMVSVFRTSDGSLVGRMVPGPEVGGASGWVDESHGIRAFKRANGEYLVLVEEDYRAKNILYRWTPKELEQ